MAKSPDVFVSYAHVDAAPVRAIADALAMRGVQVRLDEQDVPDFANITRAISQGLAGAKVLVAYYSESYPTRRACQWELTTALVAARHDGDPRQRALIVNPEPSSSHIHPVELRDAFYQAPLVTEDQEGLAALAERIAQHVAGLTAPLGTIGLLAGPHWAPEHRIGSAHFVGRLPELWQIHAALQADGMGSTSVSGRAVVQLRGLEGVGKSLLAEEYALRFGAAYPGGIVWIRAFGHDHALAPCGLGSVGGVAGKSGGHVRTIGWQAAIHDELRAVAVALNLPVKDPDPDRLRAQLAAAIEASGKPWLWVIDDVPDGLNDEQLNGLLAPHPLALTLLTTRSGKYDALAGSLHLEMLPKTDGYALLTSRRSPRGQAEELAARELVAELGGHALALDVAGATLAGRGGPASSAGFREPGSHILEALAGDLQEVLPGGCSASIARTVFGSIGQLDEEGVDLLRLAGELAAAPISARLLTAVFAVVDQLEGPAAARRVAAGRQQIRARSLAGPVDERADGLQVHLLVAHTARFTDPKPARRVALRAAAGAALAAIIEAADPRDAQGQPVLAEAITHARGLLGCMRDSLSEPELRLLGVVARYDYARGRYHAAASLFQQQWSTSQRELGEEHPATLAAMDSLAGTLHALKGRAGARELYEQILAARRRTLGEDHPATLAAMNNLARSLHALGELARARALDEQVLVARRQILGEGHPATLDSMSNLALVQQATGELAEARERYEQVLAARKRMLGKEHPATLAVMSNLALVRQATGELAGARELHEQVLAVCRQVLGEEHPATLAAMNNLAGMLHALGEPAGARELHEQAVVLCRRVLGDDDPDTLTAMSNLGLALHDLGELAEARQLHEQVLATRTQTLGEEHPETLDSISNLALVLHDLGELAEARELHQQVLATRTQTFGEQHPETLDSISNLALVLHDLGELAEARQLHEQALAACRRMFGEEHPETLDSISNLALVLHDLGELAEARQLHEQVLSVRSQVFGGGHRATLTTMSNLALVLHDLGELAEARQLHERALAACRQVLGDDHPDTLTVMNNLAGTLHDLGELAEARELHEQALAACRRVLGDDHPVTLDSMTNLAATLGAQGHYRKARKLRARAERSARRTRLRT